jgi:ABC-2 type transport system permease protein
MKHSLMLYIKLLNLRVKSARSYRFHFATSFFAVMILYGSQLLGLFITILYFKEVAGWNGYEVGLLYAFWLFSYGLQIIFFAGVRDFTGLLHRGDFDIMLVRPHSKLWQVLCGRVDLTAWAHLLASSAVMEVCFSQLQIAWSFRQLALLATLLLGAALVQAGMLLIWAAISFWTIEASSLTLFAWQLNANYFIYPLSAFDKTVQTLATWFPIAFITYYPVAALLGKSDAPAWGGYTLPVGLLFFCACLLLWNIASRSYKSAGG